MSDLPPGWEWATLEELGVEAQPGFASGKHNRNSDGVLHLRPMNITRDGKLDLTDARYVQDGSSRRVCNGDVLFNNTNSPTLVGKTTIVTSSRPLAYSNHMTRLRAPSGLDAEFLAHQLYRLWIDGYFKSVLSHHVNQASVSSKVLLQTRVAVPPFAEQQRIVAALEDHLSRLDAADRLVADSTQRLSSWLGRAFEETALLCELRGYPVRRDEILARRAKQRRGRSVAPPCSPSPYALSNNWTWCSIDEVALLVTDGDHNPPKRVSSGVPHVTAKGIRAGKILLDQCTFISEAGYAQTAKRYEPRSGDVIVTCVGTIGRVAIVPAGIRFSADRNLAVIRPDTDIIMPNYLELVLNSRFWQQRMNGLSGSTAQPHLYLADLRSMGIPIPPLEVQQAAVVLSREISTAALRLHSELKRVTARSARLRRALFAEAFGGCLAAQDPDDEPASVLLERIRVERAAQSKWKRTRPTKQSDTTQEALP